MRASLAIAAVAVARLAGDAVVDIAGFVFRPDGAGWNTRSLSRISSVGSSLLGILSEEPSLGDASDGESDDDSDLDLHSCVGWVRSALSFADDVDFDIDSLLLLCLICVCQFCESYDLCDFLFVDNLLPSMRVERCGLAVAEGSRSIGEFSARPHMRT